MKTIFTVLLLIALPGFAGAQDVFERIAKLEKSAQDNSAKLDALTAKVAMLEAKVDSLKAALEPQKTAALEPQKTAVCGPNGCTVQTVMPGMGPTCATCPGCNGAQGMMFSSGQPTMMYSSGPGSGGGLFSRLRARRGSGGCQ